MPKWYSQAGSSKSNSIQIILLNAIALDLLQKATHSVLTILKSLLPHSDQLHFGSLLLWQLKKDSRCTQLIYLLLLSMENSMK